MVYRFMVMYSNDKTEKETEFVYIYSTQSIKHIVNGQELKDSTKEIEIFDRMMTTFINKHINDVDLKILGVFSIKKDENPKELLFIPLTFNVNLENF